MNILKRLCVRYQIKKDEKFLISEGFRKIMREGLAEIHLPSNGKGRDSRELIALVADDFPERTQRYLDNKKYLVS